MGSRELKSKPALTRADVLGLDLATMTGYYSLHESGVWNFFESKVRNENKQHKALRDTLIAFIKRYDIKQIVAEDVVGVHFVDTRKLSEFRGILLEVCDELSLPTPEFVNPMTLKKFATGNGRATKIDMINACVERYNYKPFSDDEADALHLFYYYLRKYRIV